MTLFHKLLFRIFLDFILCILHILQVSVMHSRPVRTSLKTPEATVCVRTAVAALPSQAL